ncbi:MAG TPA: hypothetical protein VEB66_04460 [Opitutaceae bacterium]|nr:hypothetical protein [Opitutaceae bacterium]
MPETPVPSDPLRCRWRTLLALGAAGALASAAAGPVLPAAGATHVTAITDTRIVVVAGRTYAFTVDTPEDAGLVSTVPTVPMVLAQLVDAAGRPLSAHMVDTAGNPVADGPVMAGFRVRLDGAAGPDREIELRPLAVAGRLEVHPARLTARTPTDVTLRFTAGQRSGRATVRLRLPTGIEPSLDTCTVNVIGRGAVTLRDLERQSLGRVGSAYSYARVGTASIEPRRDGGRDIVLRGLDLRPANGADVEVVIPGVALAAGGSHAFAASYTTAEPEELTSAGVGPEAVAVEATDTIGDLARVPPRGPYHQVGDQLSEAVLRWSPNPELGSIRVLQSTDEGRSWQPVPAELDPAAGRARVRGLAPDRHHQFRLEVEAGPHAGRSNIVRTYSGLLDVKSLGVPGDGQGDDTDRINAAIDRLAAIGGGTLRFSAGIYRVRTVRLRSHVWLHIDRDAAIFALRGGDAPETTWFSDRQYRSGLSPTDAGPYENPENWLTKQDVGHHYFRNTMFFGERLENVKIIGTGRISGDGNLVTGDRVMNNPPDNRSDKMFTFKLCRDIEIGGHWREADLWYDPARDEPYYALPDGTRDFAAANMLHIDRGGHFVLLATGTDGVRVHNTYFARHHEGNARDLYDFMQCNDVAVTNIYSKVSSDDIVKLGSDCSLGFTRPVRGYRVRNVIGDTNCNLFQIGSETADDIQDVHVDNIFVTGANKAGFSISTNDGAHVKDIHLNCGHTGPLHARSRMLRTHAPFFISISNRARVLGATVRRFKFEQAGRSHDELLATNINIGVVENVILQAVDIAEQYAGSSHGNAPRWSAYDGKQRKAAPIVAGYQLPDTSAVAGGLDFRLPNGRHTGYVRNIVFRDVHFLAKGGNPASDAARQPPELGVGQYNVANLGILPAYGLYARHVAGLILENCSFRYEARDSTPALLLDDVTEARLADVHAVRARDQPAAVRLKGTRGVVVESLTVHEDAWGQSPRLLAGPPVSIEGDASLP